MVRILDLEVVDGTLVRHALDATQGDEEARFGLAPCRALRARVGARVEPLAQVLHDVAFALRNRSAFDHLGRRRRVLEVSRKQPQVQAELEQSQSQPLRY